MRSLQPGLSGPPTAAWRPPQLGGIGAARTSKCPQRCRRITNPVRCTLQPQDASSDPSSRGGTSARPAAGMSGPSLRAVSWGTRPASHPSPLAALAAHMSLWASTLRRITAPPMTRQPQHAHDSSSTAAGGAGPVPILALPMHMPSSLSPRTADLHGQRHGHHVQQPQPGPSEHAAPTGWPWLKERGGHDARAEAAAQDAALAGFSLHLPAIRLPGGAAGAGAAAGGASAHSGAEAGEAQLSHDDDYAQAAGTALTHHSSSSAQEALTGLYAAGLSFKERIWLAALWHVGIIAFVASESTRRIPSPASLPDLMYSQAARLQWGALGAVHGVEEAVAHGAVSAAAAAMSTGVSLPVLLRHQRARLLASLLLLQDLLNTLQRSCSTHDTLAFVLRTLLPDAREELLLRLAVATQRSRQLAALQGQQEALWQPPSSRRATSGGAAAGSSSSSQHNSGRYGRRTAQNQPLGSPDIPRGQSAPPPAGRQGSHVSNPPMRPLGPSAAGSGAAPSSRVPRRPYGGYATPAVSASWWDKAFAGEAEHCARLVSRMGAPPPPSSSVEVAADRFDLRDLYRLSRMVDIAVAELKQQQQQLQF